MSWLQETKVSKEELVVARRQVHCAVDLIATAEGALAIQLPDDSHRSLGWHSASLAFESIALPGQIPFVIRVAVPDLNLEIWQSQGVRLHYAPLIGGTLRDGLDELQRHIPVDLKYRQFDLAIYDEETPDPAWFAHPFPAEGREARIELGQCYDEAFHLLTGLNDKLTARSAIRTWPHHFDMACLYPGYSPGSSIGVGMSPGDHDYPEPYWYLNIYPYRPDMTLPALSGWQVHSEGWHGLVLTLSNATPRLGDDLFSGLASMLELTKPADT